MATSSVKLVGGDRLDQQFAALGAAASGQLLLHALIAGALLVANDAKRRAPYLRGNLRRSIHVGGEGAAGGLAGKTTGTDIGGQVVGPTNAEVDVGTNVEYARRLELGFVGTDSLGRTYNQPPHPFLRPALESQRKAVQKEIGEAFVDLMKAAI